MTMPQSANASQSPSASSTPAINARIIPLRLPGRWHDPLKLIGEQAPGETGRIVLWSVSLLVLASIFWAALGQLDIIASAEGKLATQTLVKIVQPAEGGVIKQLLVNEGDTVKAGQVLARLDATLAGADKAGISSELAIQQMQSRRIHAELSDQPMMPKAGDAPMLYAQVQSQHAARRQAYMDSLDHEKALLAKAEHEKRSAAEILHKLEQTLPTYRRSADAYGRLEKEGFVGNLMAAEKQREALEKAKDLDAQHATVAALNATIAAQRKRISQLQSSYKSELQKELADVQARIAQLQPNLDKTLYKEGLMELRAPQDGVIKDLATTTQGAVVQPGSVVMTLVPKGEQLYADVHIRNEDVGFVQVGQSAQVKLAAYPFQRHGMLSGKVIHLSADATEAPRAGMASGAGAAESAPAPANAIYKARIRLDAQVLNDAQGNDLLLTPGMQVVAEVNQGKRTVLEYLLLPVQKAVKEAGRER
ncbi:MAG: HlyD family type secretion periplasmic adaptor subunit [Noviherbaspirillum sp.]|nr:HlyD family type secretion periplasmic adaptor subunit [Noviherbaspirillum sp.]